MAEHVPQRRVSAHFVQRAMERMGCTAEEATDLGCHLSEAVQTERWDIVRFVTRVDRKGARIFQFRHGPTHRVWYVLIDTTTFICITVLPAGIVVPRQNKGRLRLKEEDL